MRLKRIEEVFPYRVHRSMCFISKQEAGYVTVKYIIKIGYYNKKIKMALQTAESPVRYGVPSEWERLSSYRNQQSQSYEDNLPKDPRQWSREDVAQWLRHVTSVHNLPEVPSSRFLMNGKALCLMSPSMFLSRVPLGGKLLYKDFQLRLCAALYSRN
ncbi:hypothetical protein NQ318_002206 [Aromia moschata]|uniref:PNT domain-containing protein n=1 Tax=Aromia moschata TaxID=1265417 RepID=A0AAV8Z5C7_9CUCU|nr:hypothetical protein NQ318_002206 [Aromia moschata]